MSGGPASPREKRKWYAIALRHLRIASRLERSGFVDGMVFHAYHAYECAVSALIAARGHPVPPQGRVVKTVGSGASAKTIRFYNRPGGSGTLPDEGAHKVRWTLFALLADKSKPYYRTHAQLSRFLTTNERNAALYYDPVINKLPHEVYTPGTTAGLLEAVKTFVKEVWQDIR